MTWILCSARLPDPKGRLDYWRDEIPWVIGWRKSWGGPGECYWDGKCWYAGLGPIQKNRWPTHWCPFPNPPEEK